jgi:hypothetical protein
MGCVSNSMNYSEKLYNVSLKCTERLFKLLVSKLEHQKYGEPRNTSEHYKKRLYLD